MTTHALITPEGELSFADGEWRPKVGREGPSRVRLMPEVAMSGWVNDCGLAMPERYPRNTIGALVLICLGANVQPFAGTVVITGWHACGNCPPRELPLGDGERDYLPHLVDDLTRALDGRPVSAEMQSTSWPESIRAIAEMVRTAPVPAVHVRTYSYPKGGMN